MKLFCINLKRITERRRTFQENWIDRLGFDIKFFEAIDKHSISDSDINIAREQLSKLSFTPYGTFYNHRYSLSGIVACCQSHMKLLESIENEIDDDGVVIFEDDVLPLKGAENLKERIALARKYSPQLESIMCFSFLRQRRMYGFQVLMENLHREPVTWNEQLHSTVVPESKSSIVKIAPPGAFLNWYSKDGVRNMIKLIKGREFISVDVFYGYFAQKGTLGILTPGLAYHPHTLQSSSTITTPPYDYYHDKIIK